MFTFRQVLSSIALAASLVAAPSAALARWEAVPQVDDWGAPMGTYAAVSGYETPRGYKSSFPYKASLVVDDACSEFFVFFNQRATFFTGLDYEHQFKFLIDGIESEVTGYAAESGRWFYFEKTGVDGERMARIKSFKVLAPASIADEKLLYEFDMDGAAEALAKTCR